jgi:hypothetical protein
MPIYNFDNKKEEFSTIDQFTDFRSDIEKENTLLAKYNHARGELTMAEHWALELMHIAGAPIIVYKRLMIEHAQGTIEALWEEERKVMYDGGTWVKGVFKADPLNVVLTKFGVDMPLKINVNFSRAIAMKLFGEGLIRIGDVLRIPYNLPYKKFPQYFRVENCFDSGNYQFRWLYWSVNTTLIDGDETIRPFVEYEKSRNWL